MYSDVRSFVSTCQVCQMHGRSPSQAPILGHIKATRPGEAWVVDVLHMLPSEQGHVAVLVAVDVFSRYACLMPMFSIESEEAAELFNLYVIGGPGGVPSWVLTDNGSEFQGEFEKVCSFYNIEHKVSAPNHADSHGMVERLIATTELTLAHFIDEDLTVWHKFLSHAQAAHNSEPHPALSQGSTKAFTPAEVFLGRKLLAKLDVDLQTDITKEVYGIEQYVKQLQAKLPAVTKFVQDSQQRYHERMEKTSRNRNRKLRLFKVGDLVKLFKKPRHKKIAKLGRTWQGPYRIVNITDDGGNVDIKHVAADALIDNQSIKFIGAYAEAKGAATRPRNRLQPATSFQRWEVEAIIGDRGEHGIDKEFEVKWKGDWGNSWEPADNLDCPRLVQNYLRSTARVQPTSAAACEDSDYEDPDSDCESVAPWAMTIRLDLNSLSPQDMTAEICRLAGVTQSTIAAQMAPVPCESYSILGRCNEGNGWHYRQHQHPDKPPRDDNSDKHKMAKLHDRLVSNILTAWKCDADAGYHQSLFMENPVGFLQHRPFIKRAERMLQLVKNKVHYCAFGHVVKKPTNIWSNIQWSPQGNTGDGLCHGKCGAGKVSDITGKYVHFKAIGQEPSRECGVQVKNSIPSSLLEELISPVVSLKLAGQDTIIDLCAGYQSLRPIAIKYGFNYIAVDIMGDRSDRRRKKYTPP